MFSEEGKMQNNVQNICGKTMKSHFMYVNVSKCIYVYVCNIM